MTDEAKLIVNTLRECAVATQCSKCVVFCENDECLFTAAAKMIESISAELEQVKREKDAAVEDLGEFCYDLCKVCMYSDVDITNEPCKSCDAVINKGNWQWRGPQEEPHD